MERGKHDLGSDHPDRGLSAELGYDPAVAELHKGQRLNAVRVESTDEYLLDMRRRICNGDATGHLKRN